MKMIPGNDCRNQSVPNGTYLCKLADIHKHRKSKGKKFWELTWEIIHNEQEGQFIYDTLLFDNPRELGKVKFVCLQLGLRCNGVAELTPSMLRGKRAVIETEDEYSYVLDVRDVKSVFARRDHASVCLAQHENQKEEVR